MKVYHLPGKGPYYTNSYMICSDGGSAVLIDCSADPAQVKKIAENDRVSLCAVLLTHGHADHIETLDEIKSAFSCPVYLAAEDARLFGIDGVEDYPRGQGQEDVFEPRSFRMTFGDLSVYCIFTPGHTPGGVCILCDGYLFSGDTLFAGTVGRTDMSGGDWQTLEKSLEKLVKMIKGDVKVLPGHNHFSTFWVEKKSNPYLKKFVREESI